MAKTVMCPLYKYCGKSVILGTVDVFYSSVNPFTVSKMGKECDSRP